MLLDYSDNSLNIAAAVHHVNLNLHQRTNRNSSLLCFSVVVGLMVGLSIFGKMTIKSENVSTKPSAIPVKQLAEAPTEKLEKLNVQTSWNSLLWPKIKSSIVRVDVENGHGTGVAISKHLIITCWHVIIDNSKVTTVRLSESGAIHSVECVYVDQRNDFAILHTDVEMIPLPITPTDDGEEVATFNSAGETFVGFVNFHCEQKIESNAEALPGFSGGPLVNRQCKVVGINKSVLRFSEARPITSLEKINHTISSLIQHQSI